MKADGAGMMTLTLKIYNDTDKALSLVSRMIGESAGDSRDVSGIYLIDSANKKRYLPVKDTAWEVRLRDHSVRRAGEGLLVDLGEVRGDAQATVKTVTAVVPLFLPARRGGGDGALKMLRALMLLALLASPALAQEQTRAIDRGHTGPFGELPRRSSQSVVDISGATRDLVLPVQDMIRVTQVAKEVKIELPADVLFDFDKSEIRPDAAIALSAAADLLRKGVVGAIKIDGHADSKGAVRLQPEALAGPGAVGAGVVREERKARGQPARSR